jgi:hypothetical protein
MPDEKENKNIISEDIICEIKRWYKAGWEYRLICKILRKRYDIKITKEKLMEITSNYAET